MNILFICDEYPPGKNGGIGSITCVLGRELVKQGHHVYVVGLYPYSYGGKDYEEDNGVKVWRKRYGLNLGSNAPLLYKILNKLPGFIKTYVNGNTAFNRFIQFIEQLTIDNNIDIIEIPDWNTFAMNIGFVVSWPKFTVPLVLKLHGSYTQNCHDLRMPLKPHLSKIDFLLFKRADAISAVSQNTADINKKIFNLSKPVTVLYNGIDAPVHIHSGKRKKSSVVYTGTLTMKKGIYQLLKSWNLVNKEYPNAELIIFGKGKITPLLKLLSSDAAKTVYFKGHVARETVFKALSEATMAVFPSYMEAFALAPMEAMAVGCPVVNTNRSSGTELITDKENGRLIDPDDVSAMAEIITELLADELQLEKYSLKGKETILNNFTITRSAAKHIEYYADVIKNYN